MSNKDENKRGFETEELAREELIRIIETNYNPCPKRNTKPTRCYYSEHTKLWHLTSKATLTEYKK